MREYLDRASFIVISITLVLFVVAIGLANVCRMSRRANEPKPLPTAHES